MQVKKLKPPEKASVSQHSSIRRSELHPLVIPVLPVLEVRSGNLGVISYDDHVFAIGFGGCFAEVKTPGLNMFFIRDDVYIMMNCVA